MDQEHLRALIDQIQAELSGNQTLDDRQRRLLGDAQTDLQRAVNQPTAEASSVQPDGSPASPSRLQAAMVALETSHPQLAATLEQGMVALSNLGL